ncbi:hypothetical protein [Halorussus halophilus]|uniref:hypothetical protein n=1 Tax=Halorussus halophilus TaxID=2650975 RepID=UPI0013014F50|nr:hypothetical protein [Halorussus halophilus]
MLEDNVLQSGNAGFPTYYDILLACLPVPLLFGVLVGELSSISPQLSTNAGALLSALLLWHLLFRKPPTGGRGPTEPSV